MYIYIHYISYSALSICKSDSYRMVLNKYLLDDDKLSKDLLIVN